MDVTWYSGVGWKQSCSLDDCNPILFSDNSAGPLADAASARGATQRPTPVNRSQVQSLLHH